MKLYIVEARIDGISCIPDCYYDATFTALDEVIGVANFVKQAFLDAQVIVFAVDGGVPEWSPEGMEKVYEAK